MAEPAKTPSRWDAVTGRLVDYMIEHNVLSVPRDALAELADDADQMVEGDALSRRDDRYSFFHEGLFDYFVARRFQEGGRSLVDVVTGGEQALTLRPLVRRVLQAQRDDSFPRYVETVRLLLGRDDVRFLIKDAVLSVLAAAPSPQPAEWLAVAHFIEDPGAKGNSRAWRVVAQPSWFDLLDAMGVVERWLASDTDTYSDLAISLLRSVDNARPARVAELVAPKLGASDVWDRRVTWLLSTSDLSGDPSLVALAASAIERGLQDTDDGSLSGELLVMSGHRLPETDPRGAVDLLEALLRRAMKLVTERGETDPFDFRTGILRVNDHEQVTTKAAQAEPAYFAERLLPLMLDLADANRSTRHPPHRDSIWGYRHIGGRHDLEDELLRGMTKSLRELATSDHDAFVSHASVLMESDELETALALLYRAWSAAPEQYASDAILFLIGSDDRLATGTMDRNYWETAQLIRAIAPHAAAKDLTALEEFLLGYYSWWEREQGQDERGRAQAELLLAIPEELQSEAVRARVALARERFSERALEGEPEPIRVGYVGSPIDREEAESYSDDDWVDAIRRFDRDDERSIEEFRGGAHQLAQVLEDFTKRDPDRFGRLALRLPDDVNVSYFHALLRGLGEAEEPPEPDVAFDTMRRCHAIPGRPCGRWIARPAKHFIQDDIPPAILALVAWYVTGADDPDHESWQTLAAGGEPYYGGDPHNAGINTARGSAAEDLAELIWPSPERLDLVRDDVRKLVHDPIVAVRTCAATTLYAAYHHDEDFAVELFGELVTEAPDILLRTRPVERFLHFALRTHIEEITPVIYRMLGSDEADVREVGGRQACFAALDHTQGSDLSDQALRGDARTRTGAAQVFAANVNSAAFRALCVDALTRLFHDEDEGVREEAGECFRYIDDDKLDEFRDLIMAFIDSPAFVDDHFHLLQAIEESPTDLSAEAIAAGRAFIDRIVRLGQGAGPPARALHSSTISTVVMRAYRRADTSSELRSQALDVMDDLLASQVYGIERELEQFEAS